MYIIKPITTSSYMPIEVTTYEILSSNVYLLHYLI